MLAEAINSVLNQTQKSLEVIVVDDCSTDGTEEYVKSITDERVRFYRKEKNSGQEYSRMFGLRLARGKYITFLDDDDYYTDYEFFARAVKIFEEKSNEDAPLAIVCADGESLYVENGRIVSNKANPPGLINGVDFAVGQERKYSKPLSTFPALFSAEILRQAGLDNMTIHDTATYMQAALLGNVWIMPEKIGIYRIHSESNTKGRKRSPEWSKRRLAVMADRIKRDGMIREKMIGLASRVKADAWFIRMLWMHIGLHTENGGKQGKSFMSSLKVYAVAAGNLGFNITAWLSMPFMIIRDVLRRVKFLKALYRKIRRRDTE